ncbi:MAG TPA: AIPR family protein [Candidatus Portnoybacteria bacterium]|nr:AIPR family protein [Candidatus Portnoybacteria bacterium]
MPPKTYHQAYEAREDLKKFKTNSLALFALELKFGIEDIENTAQSSITAGPNDKKADIVYIDTENHVAVISQAYISEKDKKEAPANKASDLNTAVSSLISTPPNKLPPSLQSHAQELQNVLKDGQIETLHIWYVHNLDESKNVANELQTVEHTTNSALIALIGKTHNIEIRSLEVGKNTLEEWYQSLLSPILITDIFYIPVKGGLEIRGDDWSAYLTTISAKWLKGIFKKYGSTKLLSANVREYLGSRNTDKNINKGIQKTALSDPSHFCVFNNGITALVNNYKTDKSNRKVEINGLSIVNGAQTVGAIGTAKQNIKDSALVQVRFIKCTNPNTVQNIVKYNNSQNKITAPDFRSNDAIQKRLVKEFLKIKNTTYLNRRGGGTEFIKRRASSIPSITAGQILAAFHGDPDSAYNKKTYIWESDSLYSKFFNEKTTAKHIYFVYALMKSIEKKKLELFEKKKQEKNTSLEEQQLSFFRNRGSNVLFLSATARSLETILGIKLPNLFCLCFKATLTLSEAIKIWDPIIQSLSSFSKQLDDGLSDGIKNKQKINSALEIFQSLVDSTKGSNKKVFDEFKEKISY